MKLLQTEFKSSCVANLDYLMFFTGYSMKNLVVQRLDMNTNKIDEHYYVSSFTTELLF